MNGVKVINFIAIFCTTEKHDVNLSMDILYRECVEFIKWLNKLKVFN